MEKIEILREYFANDKYATEGLNATIDEVGENYAKVSMVLDARHKNARGEIMGGVYFTLADFAFAVSTNEPGKDTVSTVSQISYLRPVKGDVLIAESKVVKEGRTLCYYNVELTDACGKPVATVAISGMHL